MATSYIRAAEDELSCPIFVDPNTPKTLPCGHVCCEVCLENMAAGIYDKKCPECTQIISIPKDGVTSFLTNLGLRTMANNHRKIADGQSLGGGQAAKPTVCTCQVHDGEKMHYYCTPCNMLACHVCFLKHSRLKHNIDDVKEKYSQQKVEMQSSIEEAGRDILQAKSKMETLRMQVDEEHHLRINLEKDIDACFEECIKRVQEQRQKLKYKVQQDQQRRIKDLEQRISVGEEEIRSAERSHRNAINALEINLYEYVTQHTSLLDKMKTHRLGKRLSRIRTSPYAGTTFVQSIAQDITLGRLVATQELKLIQIKDGLKSALATACSADGLLLAVCNYEWKKLMIYRKASNGQYKKSHTLNLRSSNPHGPTDVTICSDGRFLVARCTHIEVYTPEGKYLKKVINTAGKSGTAMHVQSVTTTSNGNLLAGDIARSVITEHDPTGIVRTIKTKIRPFYITLIHDTHIAMSDYQSGKLSVMDIQSGQETLSIDIPQVCGISYDEQTDCLLTVRSEADISNPGLVLPNTGVIEQYCWTTGRLIACLTKGLYKPEGIGFVSVGILVVADRKTVKLYKM